ncbi:hypothetical protein PTKIN_Ptkin06aG0083200 [Pterospermum kingtungense]
MKISSINWTAFFALLLALHILITMCFCHCHCHCHCHGDGERIQSISRKPLSSAASFPTDQGNKLMNGTMKEPKKAVEPGLRKALPSVSNPIQN